MVKDPRVFSHFKLHDPILFSLIQTVTIETVPIKKQSDYFVSLCREIIGQQLSGRVADVIFDRFTKVFPRRKVNAVSVRNVSDDALRATGMSWSKVGYIRDLSDHVHAKHIDLSLLSDMSDEEVIAYLTKIKGIGPWTAEMFLIFTLGRPDVFSYGDLGLRKAIQKLYILPYIPTQKQMEKIVMKWQPYRTYGARLLWRYLDV